MNYGLHLSTTGALVSLHKMDVLANNLANANTPQFNVPNRNRQDKIFGQVTSTASGSERHIQFSLRLQF